MKLFYYKKEVQPTVLKKDIIIDGYKYILMDRFDIFIRIDYVLLFIEYIKFGRSLKSIIEILKYIENKH